MKLFVVSLFFFFVFVSADLVALKQALDKKELFSQTVCTKLKQFHGAFDPNSGDQCSYLDSCSSNLEAEASLTCQTGYGTDQDCGCSSGSSKINKLRASVKFAPGSSTANTNTKAFLCSTAQISPIFQKNSVDDSKLVWQYVGSEYGATFYFPAKRWTYQLDSKTGCQKRSTCPIYDPRFRPWYIAAASGPKKVVLIIDTSGSMSISGRMGIAIAAAKTVIDGLGFVDYVSVVKFSSSASDGTSGKLVRATYENREFLKNYIDSFVASGGTNFLSAFSRAYDILDASDPNIPRCHTSLVFLTDGEGSSPISIINSRNLAYDARVFSFTFGSGADKSVPTQIACSTKGLFTHVPDGGDLRSQMAGYYKYFALDVAGTRKSVWTEFYNDFSLNISMTTSASACFDKSGELLGVAGVDVLEKDLVAIHNNKADIENEIRSRSATCPDFQQSEEILNKLRGGSCNYCNGCGAGAAFSSKIIGTFTVVCVFISIIFSLL
eukprot:gene10116-2535_t